jgi:CheY-like chemotaxis protein
MADKGKKILVIDDEADVVTYLTTLLEDNGYATCSACNGNQALDKVKSEKPDLVTLDITMPEKSGVKFYREMKESPDWKNIPIIVVTGISEDFKTFISTRKQVPPPEGYIQKPIDRQQMLDTVKKLLA